MASNERVEAVNRSGGQWINPVETLARGVAPNGTNFLTTWVRLPPLDREEHAMGQYLWPMLINSRLLSQLTSPRRNRRLVPRYVGLARWSRRSGLRLTRRGEVLESICYPDFPRPIRRRCGDFRLLEGRCRSATSVRA